MLSFKPDFSLCSFTLIKSRFSSSSLSVIKVVSSGYLTSLIFLQAILMSDLYNVIYQLYLNKAEKIKVPPSLYVNCDCVFQTKTRSLSEFSACTLPCTHWALVCFSVFTHSISLFPSFSIIYTILIWSNFPPPRSWWLTWLLTSLLTPSYLFTECGPCLFRIMMYSQIVLFNLFL